MNLVIQTWLMWFLVITYFSKNKSCVNQGVGVVLIDNTVATFPQCQWTPYQGLYLQVKWCSEQSSGQICRGTWKFYVCHPMENALFSYTTSFYYYYFGLFSYLDLWKSWIKFIYCEHAFYKGRFSENFDLIFFVGKHQFHKCNF